MPGVPIAPYSTGTQVLAVVRSLCNDIQGQLYTPAYCIANINAANRYVAQELRNRGKKTLINDEVLVTIPAVTTQDPTQQVNLTFTGISGDVTPGPTPALPATLVEPLELWERPTASSTRFQYMRNMTAHGGLSKVMQGGLLREWEWRQEHDRVSRGDTD